MSQIFQRIADPIGSFIFQCGKNPLNGTEAEARNQSRQGEPPEETFPDFP